MKKPRWLPRRGGGSRFILLPRGIWLLWQVSYIVSFVAAARDDAAASGCEWVFLEVLQHYTPPCLMHWITANKVFTHRPGYKGYMADGVSPLVRPSVGRSLAMAFFVYVRHRRTKKQQRKCNKIKSKHCKNKITKECRKKKNATLQPWTLSKYFQKSKQQNRQASERTSQHYNQHCVYCSVKVL